VFLSIGVALMYFAFRNVDPIQMWARVMKANFWWILLSLVFSTLAHASRAYRWSMLIGAVNKKPKFSNTFYALAVGYFANMAVPRLGEVTRCTALYEVEKTPIDSMVGTVIMERVVDVISLFSLIVLVLLVNMELFSGFFKDMASEKLQGLQAVSQTTWIILVAAIILFFVVLIILRKKFMKIKIVEKVMNFLKGIMDGFRSVLKVKNKWAFLFHSVFIWAMYFVSGYITFFSMPETAHLGLAAALFLLVLGGIGMSAPAPGGFGPYHIFVSAGLTLYGITKYIDPATGTEINKGLDYAFVVHSSQVLLIIVLGSLSLIMLNIVKRKQLASNETK